MDEPTNTLNTGLNTLNWEATCSMALGRNSSSTAARGLVNVCKPVWRDWETGREGGHSKAGRDVLYLFPCSVIKDSSFQRYLLLCQKSPHNEREKATKGSSGKVCSQESVSSFYLQHQQP